MHPFLTAEAAGLIRKLLRRTPANRLGAGLEDGEEVKRHPFFSHLDWSDVLNRRLQPPFQPVVIGEEDTGQFDTEYTKQLPVDTPDDKLVCEASCNVFEGFSYVAPSLLSSGSKPLVVNASPYPMTPSELFPTLGMVEFQLTSR